MPDFSSLSLPPVGSTLIGTRVRQPFNGGSTAGSQKSPQDPEDAPVVGNEPPNSTLAPPDEPPNSTLAPPDEPPNSTLAPPDEPPNSTLSPIAETTQPAEPPNSMPADPDDFDDYLKNNPSVNPDENMLYNRFLAEKNRSLSDKAKSLWKGAVGSPSEADTAMGNAAVSGKGFLDATSAGLDKLGGVGQTLKSFTVDPLHAIGEVASAINPSDTIASTLRTYKNQGLLPAIENAVSSTGAKAAPIYSGLVEGPLSALYGLTKQIAKIDPVALGKETRELITRTPDTSPEAYQVWKNKYLFDLADSRNSSPGQVIQSEEQSALGNNPDANYIEPAPGVSSVSGTLAGLGAYDAVLGKLGAGFKRAKNNPIAASADQAAGVEAGVDRGAQGSPEGAATPPEAPPTGIQEPAPENGGSPGTPGDMSPPPAKTPVSSDTVSGLQALGYTAEQIAKMDADSAQAILKTGKSPIAETEARPGESDLSSSPGTPSTADKGPTGGSMAPDTGVQQAIATAGKPIAPSLTDRVIGGVGKAAEATGRGVAKAAALPRIGIQKILEHTIGRFLPEAAQGPAEGFLAAHGIEKIPGLGHALAGLAATEGAASIGTKIGRFLQSYAEADATHPYGRLASIAANPETPGWLKTVVNMPSVKGAAALKDVIAGTAPNIVKNAVLGGAVNAGIGAASGEGARDIGGDIGSGAVFGGALGGLSAFGARRAQIFARQHAAMTDWVHAHIAEGIKPETLAKVPDAVATEAATMEKLGLRDGKGNPLKIRVLDKDAYEAKAGGYSGTDALHSPLDNTIYMNGDQLAKNGTWSTLFHEAMHPLFDSVVANHPELKSQMDAAMAKEGKTLDQAKAAYAYELIKGQLEKNGLVSSRGGKPFIKDPEKVQKAIQDTIGERTAMSSATYGDGDHWIYSEIMADAAKAAMRGKDTIEAIKDGGVKSTAAKIATQLFEKLGGTVRPGPKASTVIPGFENVIADPSLRQSVYRLLRAQKDYVPGKTKVPETGVRISKDMWGKSPMAPLHDLGNGVQGNDFVVQSKNGTVLQRSAKAVKKIAQTRRDEMNKIFPTIGRPLPIGDKTPQVSNRRSLSGKLERSGTILGDAFQNASTVGAHTKAFAKDLESAIANGEARSGIYHQIATGEGAKRVASLEKDSGNLEAQAKDFIPYGFTVSKAGNVLVNNYDLSALMGKAKQWQEAHGPLSLGLWNGDISAFRNDVRQYLKNHAEGLPGDANNLGVAKKDTINAFLAGGNRTFEGSNPLRHMLKGDNRRGIIRSYRLDRLETLEPHDANMAKPDYASQLKNFSPTSEKPVDSDLKVAPMLKLDGKQFIGGRTHSQILMDLMQQDLPADKLEKYINDFQDDATHKFVDANGKEYSRDELEAATGARTSEQLPDKNILPAAKNYSPAMAPLNEDLGKKVADWYENAQHEPENPKVKASYKAMSEEAVDQFKQAQAAGMKFEPWTKKGQPYKDSKEMIADVKANKHLYYFPTKEGFGTAEAAGHPMLADSGMKDADGNPMPVNDVFRAIHDFFGHAATGASFGPRGEYNAFLAHSRMFSDEAKPAMAAETMGQNSWVNFGKHLRDEAGNVPAKGEPGYKSPTERPYAAQKATVLPPDLLNAAKTGQTPGNFSPQVREALAAIPGATGDNLPEQRGFYWLTPEGKFINVSHHAQLSDQLGVTEPDMYGNGLLRTVVTRGPADNLIVSLNSYEHRPTLSPKQAQAVRALKDRDFVVQSGAGRLFSPAANKDENSAKPAEKAPSTPKQERILRPAVQDERGEVWDDAIDHLDNEHEGEQGFITSTGRFVGRKLAYKIALAAKQLKPSNWGPERGLFTEDFTPDYRQQPKQFSPEVKAEDEKAPVYYSQLQKTVESKFSGKQMPAAQLAAQLRAPTSGVKADELKWSGLDDFLKGKGRVTKDEVQDFLKANQLQVKEVTRGQQQYSKEMRNYLRDTGNDDMSSPPWGDIEQILRLRERNASSVSQARDARELANEAAELSTGVQGGSDETKFENYQLPGGENYREILFQLPVKPYTPKKLTGGFEDSKSYSDNEAAKGFKSQHWDEPNVLAHTRVNDRADAAGKPGLFAEELQSDWHQKGRKHGYQSPKVEAERVAKEKRGKEVEAKLQQMISDSYSADRPAFLSSADKGITRYTMANILYRENPEFKALRDELDTLTPTAADINRGEVPDAPYKTTWHELVLRRLVRMAAEEGKDWLGWTTGEQQAERYDLSKQIQRIELQKGQPAGKGDQRNWLAAYDHDGRRVVNQMVSDSEIPDYIGKEAAEKLTGQDWTKYNHENNNGSTIVNDHKVLSGLDLKVGGEGMKGFYDKILVDYANKFGKKFGAQVEDRNINAGEKAVVTPLFARSIFEVTTPEGTKQRFSTLENAQKYADVINAEAPRGAHTVHSLPITPEMKKSVLGEGVAQFSPETKAEKAGAYFGDVSDDGEVWSKSISADQLSSTLHDNEVSRNMADTKWRLVGRTLYWWGHPDEVQEESVKAHLEKKGRKINRSVLLNNHDPSSKTFDALYNKAHGLFSPAANRGFIGQVNDDGTVEGDWTNLAKNDHASLALGDGKSFRYVPRSKKVYWWGSPDEGHKEAVENFMARKNFEVLSHHKMEATNAGYKEAHGGQPHWTEGNFSPATLPVQKDGTAKAWILPDGKIQPLKGMHYAWINENAKNLLKYGLRGGAAMTDSPKDKAKALDAGLGRINIGSRDGTLTAEFNDQKFNQTAKDALRKTIKANIDDITAVKVSLLSKGGKDVTGSDYARVDRDMGKVDAMPTFSGEKPGTHDVASDRIFTKAQQEAGQVQPENTPLTARTANANIKPVKGNFSPATAKDEAPGNVKGWLSPSGDFHPLGGVPHELWARQGHGDLDAEDQSNELYKQGWLRVTPSGDNSIASNGSGAPSFKQAAALRGIAESNGLNSWHHDNGKKTSILWSKNNQFSPAAAPLDDQTIDRYAKRIAKVSDKDGALTFNVATGKNISDPETESYGVSIYPDKSKIFDKGQTPTEEDFKDFIKANAHLFSNSENSLGVWKDPASGKTYLDVAWGTPDLALAKYAGKKYNQIAIWDGLNKKEIQTGGDGTVNRNLGPAQDRIDTLKNDWERQNELLPGAGKTPTDPKVKANTVDSDLVTPKRELTENERAASKAAQAELRSRIQLLPDTDAKVRARRALTSGIKNVMEYQAKAEADRNFNSGADWYNRDIKNMERTTKEIFPETKDADKMKMFKVLLATLSPSQKPSGNYSVTAEAFSQYLKTGKVPGTSAIRQKVGGKPQQLGIQAVASARNLNDMLEHFGSEKKLLDYLTTKHETTMLGHKDAYGALDLGPKVGRFFLNLTGHAQEVTVDMWATRTWNRWMGTPFRKTGEMADIPTDDERNLAMESFQKISDAVSKHLDKPLTPMAVQAILWFYEKDLFAKHGARAVDRGLFSDAATQYSENQIHKSDSPIVTGAGAPKREDKNQQSLL